MVSGQYQSVLDDLHGLMIDTITVPPCSDLQVGVSCHADMICYHDGENKLIMYDYNDRLNRQLRDLGFELSFIDAKLQAEYPHDVVLNVAKVGDFVICNRKYTNCKALERIKAENIISVAQGYAKCSTLVVDKNSIITSDISIATGAKAHGLDVLQVECGYIALEGYEYGFIGGCGTKIDEKSLYFTGDLSTHPNEKEIRSFLAKRGIEVICGSAKQLIDVGSILPLLY